MHNRPRIPRNTGDQGLFSLPFSECGRSAPELDGTTNNCCSEKQDVSISYFTYGIPTSMQCLPAQALKCFRPLKTRLRGHEEAVRKNPSGNKCGRPSHYRAPHLFDQSGEEENKHAATAEDG